MYFSIHKKSMQNVVSVLEQSGAPVTKMSIANEFEMNKHVYFTLPDQPDLYQAITPPDVPNTEVVDTIIDVNHIQLIQSSSTNITTKED